MRAAAPGRDHEARTRRPLVASCLEVVAVENITNDAGFPELDGHVMDAASLEIKLAPAPVPLLPGRGIVLLIAGLIRLVLPSPSSLGAEDPSV